MEYIKKYIVKEEHTDWQGNMEGLYYPYYLEDCRHAYIKEILCFDFEEEARNGISMVLSNYRIQILRSLKGGSNLSVSCTVFRDKSASTLLHFKQMITLRGKIVTLGLFSSTCTPSNGGRSFLPPSLNRLLSRVPLLETLSNF
ncbi:acyl-CoA thioester hydrolase [Olivibacter domesticus]|uniref:Acyl-CoA thioester hydrolase n=2 Tax=Olivibacter domesticus TaxID=407022 RepID=A0A1H7ZE01_OLID1|nr:acyl-CoA thioester hydrolase [Olivibacter domesticus]